MSQAAVVGVGMISLSLVGMGGRVGVRRWGEREKGRCRGGGGEGEREV